MSNVSEFSTTAASNNSASPNGFPESMAPSGVNDSARELMAALAKWYKDTQGTITTGGTTTAYTLTTNNAHAALNDIPLFAMQINAANTGSATLNVDSLGAKTMQLDGNNLAAGDLVADEIVLAVYNPDNDVFDIFKSGTAKTVRADTINERTSASGVTVDGVLIKDGNVDGVDVSAVGSVLLQTVTASGDATIDLGEGGEIDSTYKEYLIELINVIPANDAVDLRIQTSSDTGSNYDATSSDYYWAQVLQGGGSADGTQAFSLVCASVGSDTNETGVCASIRLANPSASTYTSFHGTGMFINSSGVPQCFSHTGVRQSAGVVNAIRFIFSTGNVESGIFKLYGVM